MKPISTASIVFWNVLLGLTVTAITVRLFGDDLPGWIVGACIFGILAPLIPRLLQWRQKQIEIAERENDDRVKANPQVQQFLQEMNLTLDQVHAMSNTEVKAVVESYQAKNRNLPAIAPLEEQSPPANAKKTYYGFL